MTEKNVHKSDPNASYDMLQESALEKDDVQDGASEKNQKKSKEQNTRPSDENAAQEVLKRDLQSTEASDECDDNHTEQSTVTEPDFQGFDNIPAENPENVPAKSQETSKRRANKSKTETKATKRQGKRFKIILD